MKAVKRGVLYGMSAPWDVAVLGLSMVLLALGGAAYRRAHGAIWLDVREGSVLARRWRYSTTLGHLVLLQPGVSAYVEAHELVHVRQYEGSVCSVWLASALALVLAQLVSVTAALVVLALGAPWWSYAGASLAAWLRDERPYLDNHFERHARAETSPSPSEPARIA